MIGRVAVLLVLWVALQGDLTFGNVVGGLIVIAVLLWVFPVRSVEQHRLHPVGAVRFVARLLLDLVTSSWAVVVAVLRPTPERTRTEVIEVELSTSSRLVALVMANAITLTPGTMTVDVVTPNGAPVVLSVHVLGDIDRVAFLASMTALERRVLRAVTPLEQPSVEAERP